MNTSKMSLRSNNQSPKGKIDLNRTVYGQARNRFEENSKIVFKELMGERRCAESPGIVYDSHLVNPAINKSRQAFSFGKESRAMEYKVKSTKRVPAPG